MRTSKKRYYFIDGIRGLAVVNMVLFHFLYDVFIIFEKNPSWYGLPAIHIWQQAICWTFIFISGFVWQWGMESNLKRGLFLNLCGIAISVITLLFIPSQTIWFGILNFIGCAVLLMFPLRKAADRIAPLLGSAISFLLFLTFKNVQYGSIRVAGLMKIRMPDGLYSAKIFTPFGFPFQGFVSGDYFPVLPWIFLFLCGYFFQKIVARHEAWLRIAEVKIPLLSAIGKRSIWIYLLHQPVCMLICILFAVPVYTREACLSPWGGLR